MKIKETLTDYTYNYSKYFLKFFFEFDLNYIQVYFRSFLNNSFQTFATDLFWDI